MQQPFWHKSKASVGSRVQMKLPLVLHICSSVTAGGAEYPLIFLTRKFLLTYWERRGKGKMEKTGGKLKKRRWKIQNEGGSYKMRRGPFFYYYFFAFHFSKPLWNLFWVCQNENFLLGKSITLCSPYSEKYSSYASAHLCIIWSAGIGKASLHILPPKCCLMQKWQQHDLGLMMGSTYPLTPA